MGCCTSGSTGGNTHRDVYKSSLPPEAEETYDQEVCFDDEQFFRVQREVMGKTMHKCIGSLIGEVSQGQVKGSGFIVSPDVVLTASHNIISKRVGYIKNIKFYPGLCGDTKDHKFYCPAEEKGKPVIYIPAEYKQGRQQGGRYDFAFIKLSQPVPQAQYLTLAINFSDLMAEIIICGYPTSSQKYKINNYEIINYGSDRRVLARQYGQQCRGKMIEEDNFQQVKRLKHRINTISGQSGCPLIVSDGVNNDKVIGIHVGGSAQTFNYARFITLDFAINLALWTEKHNCREFYVYDLKTNFKYLMSDNLFYDVRSYIKSQEMSNMDSGDHLKNKKLLEQNAHLQSLLRRSENHYKKTLQDRERQNAQLKQTLQFYWNREASLKQYIKQIESNFQNFDNPQQRVWSEGMVSVLKTSLLSNSTWMEHLQSSTRYYNIQGTMITRNQFENHKNIQIVGTKPITANTTINFRLMRYGGVKQITFGLIPQSRISMQTSGHTQNSIGFSTFPNFQLGIVYQNGTKIEESDKSYIRQGQILAMFVNLDHKHIGFCHAQQRNPKVWKMPSQFGQEKIYFFVSMMEVGSCVEVVEPGQTLRASS